MWRANDPHSHVPLLHCSLSGEGQICPSLVTYNNTLMARIRTKTFIRTSCSVKKKVVGDTAVTRRRQVHYHRHSRLVSVYKYEIPFVRPIISIYGIRSLLHRFIYFLLSLYYSFDNVARRIRIKTIAIIIHTPRRFTVVSCNLPALKIVSTNTFRF